jgi:hypothetical protein
LHFETMWVKSIHMDIKYTHFDGHVNINMLVFYIFCSKETFYLFRGVPNA